MYSQKTQYIVIGLFFSLILVVLTGCGQKSPVEIYKETLKAQQEERAEKIANIKRHSIGEAIQIKDVTVKVIALEEFTDFDPIGPKPKENKQYYAMEVLMENNSAEEKIHSIIWWNLVDTNGEKYTPGFTGVTKQPRISGNTISANSNVQGWITVEVDKGVDFDYINVPIVWDKSVDQMDPDNWIWIDLSK